MTVKEFVNKYNEFQSATSKEGLIKKVITKTYIPYLQKVNMCERIVNATYYKQNEITGKQELHINSPANYLMYCLSVIDLYTDITVDYKNNLNEFDLLNEGGLLDLIMCRIPEKDLKEFGIILEMTKEDVMQNEYEIHSFIHNELTRFGELIGTIAEPGLKQLNQSLEKIDDKTIDGWIRKLQKIVKK